MARLATWCVLGACTGLAACLTNSSSGPDGPIVFDPVTAALDGIPPLGATTGVAVPLMSADRDGVRTTNAEIIFNADGTFTLNLANGSSVTVDESNPDVPPASDPVMDTTVAQYFVGSTEVNVHLGEDISGRDLFFLGWFDDSAPLASPLTWVLFGDETDTLPTGDAIFDGGFYANVLNATTGEFIGERSGDSVINADFDVSNVTISMTVTGTEGAGEAYAGVGTIGAGARYAGSITSSGGVNYIGDFNGAFFGANAEATAGTFNATDAGANQEIVGGFTGFQ